MPSYGSVHSPLMRNLSEKTGINDHKSPSTRSMSMGRILRDLLAVYCISISIVRSGVSHIVVATNVVHYYSLLGLSRSPVRSPGLFNKTQARTRTIYGLP